MFFAGKVKNFEENDKKLEETMLKRCTELFLLELSVVNLYNGCR